jgi:hypothetical protein
LTSSVCVPSRSSTQVESSANVGTQRVVPSGRSTSTSGSSAAAAVTTRTRRRAPSFERNRQHSASPGEIAPVVVAFA